MDKHINAEMRADLASFIEVQNRDKVFCAECGEECKAGTPMWNGWFMHMDTYHLKCVPQDIKEKLKI